MYIIEKKQICYNGGKYPLKTHTKNKRESHYGKRTLYREGTYKKGNLHTHTTWSDGMHTPKETAEHYRSQGYDFLALTDHWVYGIHPELNRDDFLFREVFPERSIILSFSEYADELASS